MTDEDTAWKGKPLGQTHRFQEGVEKEAHLPPKSTPSPPTQGALYRSPVGACKGPLEASPLKNYLLPLDASKSAISRLLPSDS